MDTVLGEKEKREYLLSRMKPASILFFVAWPLCAVFFSCVDPSASVPVASVSMEKNTLDLMVGDSQRIAVLVSPEDATDPSLSWTSSDASIASVDANGLVAAIAPGTAEIAVRSVDGDHGASCLARVSPRTVAVTAVSLDKTSFSIPVGGTRALVATIAPADATISAVTWSSSDPTTARVSATGLVSGLAAGTAIISATSADGAKKAECSVRVLEPSAVALALFPAPSSSAFYTRAMSDGRSLLAIGLGPELPTNEWSIWQSAGVDPIFLSFRALGGLEYGVSWDDRSDGSLAADGAKFFDADIVVSAWLADKRTAVPGWTAETDQGYSTYRKIQVAETQIIWLEIRPKGGLGSNAGGFGIKLSQSSLAASGTDYEWYFDGVKQTSRTGLNSLYLDPTVFVVGRHHVTATASRGGVLFSEDFFFVK